MSLIKINDLISDYIIDINPDENDFDFITSIIKIVLSTPVRVRTQTYHHYYDIENSIEDVSKFYQTLNPEYNDRLYHLIKSGEMRLEEVSEHSRNNFIAYSEITPEGKSNIFLPYNNTVEDSFTINHETLHDTNLIPEFIESRFLFTEAISILGEMLQEDYYKSLLNPPKEFHKNGIDVLKAVVSKSVSLKIQLGLIRLMQKYGEITKDNLSELELLKIQRRTINKYLRYYSCCDELPFDQDQTHVLGYVFASHMHQSGNGKDHLLEINPMLNKMDFVDILESIGVTVTDDGYDLSKDSKKILLKSYREEVSRFR